MGYARILTGGRTAWWQDSTGAAVIENPLDPDGGTVFRPIGGVDYFWNMQ